MQKMISKLIKHLEMRSTEHRAEGTTYREVVADTIDMCIDVIKLFAKEYGGGWIPVSERLPEVETEVLIHARRKYTGGRFKDIITTAMHEDGTVREVNSCWRWEDVDGEWDEEEDCLIIPEGWWESKHYNGDDEFNHEVDDKVIEWMPLPELPLPEPYKVESEG